MAAHLPQRSRSAPPDNVNERGGAAEEATASFPLHQMSDNYAGVDTPAWVREIDNSRVSRQSRASSIISTRTRFSTTTLDEVRSIEISAGGQTYRISRHGSRITDVTPPPPYIGAWDHLEAEQTDTPGTPSAEDEEDGLVTEDVLEPVLDHPERGRRKRVRIVMPNEEDDEGESPVDEHITTQESPSRRPLTKADVYRIMLDLPLQLNRVLGIRPLSFRSASRPDDESVRPTSSQSLPDSFAVHGQDVMVSPFNNSGTDQAQQPNKSIDENNSSVASELSRLNQDDTNMTVHDLNELSKLYNRVIRDLDREHRKRLHTRDKELAQLRFLLHEKDVVFRQQLRGKDFIIDELKQQISHQEDMMEQRLERARNEVEDTWEKRWKHRDSHLMERMRRIEDAAARGVYHQQADHPEGEPETDVPE